MNDFIDNLSLKKAEKIIWNLTDYYKIPEDDEIVFQPSIRKSENDSNSIARPMCGCDILKKELGLNKIITRKKKEIPSLGFCGSAFLPARSFIKDLKFRRVKTNFIFREEYLGHLADEQKNARDIRLRSEYVNNILNNDYNLCIRGYGNYSYRFYETLCLGRIPVFINTDCLLPLEDKIDYRKYMPWCEYQDLDNLENIILDFHGGLSESRFIELQEELRGLWVNYLQNESFKKYYPVFKKLPVTLIRLKKV